MKDFDVAGTAEAVEEMANNLRHYAEEMDRIAVKLRERNDLTYAAEAANAIGNCFGNMRIDLLVVRPIREFQKREVEYFKGNEGE